MSELLKKYESIDQSKLSEATIKILNRVKTITADFTADDAKNNDIAEKVMNEILKKNPDAVKIVKREPKAKPAPKKIHKAKGTHKAKATHKATPAPATKTSNNNIMSVAKEIQKTGESWKDAMERAKQVLKERKEQNVQKSRTEMEKLLALVRTKKELKGFANSDIKRDSVRTSKVKGSRVVTREGFTSNQYAQNVPNKLGRKYYESRENRSDRLAPNYQKDMPLLAKGGVLPDEYVRTVRWADGNYRVEKKTKQNDFGHTFNDVFEDVVKAESFAKKIAENNKLNYIGVGTMPYDFRKSNLPEKEFLEEYYKKNKFANGGSFAPNVADGTQFMNGVYADGGGIRSKEELKKIFSEKENLVKNLTPSEIAEMWNKNSYAVKKGISKPITIEEATRPSMKIYLENLLIENELTDDEQARYFANGGSFAPNVADGTQFMNQVYADGGCVNDEMYKLAKSIVRGTDYKIGVYLPFRTDFYLKDVKGRFGIGSYLVLQDEDNKDQWSVSERKYNKSQGGYYEDIKSGITQKQAYEIVRELINSKYANGGSFAPNVSDGTQFMNGVYKNGGNITNEEKLIKELHKLQRDLNSSRLSTYREGDTSQEEMDRQRERESKLARFYEVLETLRQSDAKFADGGGLEFMTDPNFGDFQNTGMFADGGSLITETVSAIFNPNQKRGKIETGFGSKTKEGLFAMMTNVNYSPEEITTAVFVPNTKKGRIYTEFGAKTKEGLHEMIENMRNTFEHGGSMANLTEQEFLKKYFGTNVFTENPSQYFEIKKMSSDDDAKVNAFVKELKADGFTVKKRAYSDFTSVMGVKKKTSFELGGAFVMTDLAGHTGGSDGLGNPMPLSGVSGTHYTGLVGETGAISSGEMFMDGGAMMVNQQVINDASQPYVITEAFGNPAQQLGILAKGGSIENQYEGRTPEDIWNSLSQSQRFHFLTDHNKSEIQSTDYSIEQFSKKKYRFLSEKVKKSFDKHIYTGQYASGGALGKALYVAYSSYFDSNKYDEEKIMSALKSIGAKNIHLENDGGMSNQPQVVVFNGSKNQATDALNEAFDTDYILVYEKDWRTKKMADGGSVDDSIIDELWSGYASAILFAEIDYDTDESLDENYSIYDFDDETVKSSKELLRRFYVENKDAIEESGMDLDRIGTDVWYTRAGHGAGFFDRNLDKGVEDKLTKGAEALGELPDVSTYDGKISVTGGKVFAKGGFVGTVEFNTGDVVWQKDEKRYATVMNNYGDPINGDYGDIRLDTTGNTSIYTFDRNRKTPATVNTATGYNLIKVGEKGDTGKFTPEVLAEMKESANRLIDSRKKAKDEEGVAYYQKVYRRLRDGEFDSMTGAKATASNKKGSSDYTYVPNKDVKELSVVVKGELKQLAGSDILDGVYVKNSAKSSKKADFNAVFAKILKDAKEAKRGKSKRFDASDLKKINLEMVQKLVDAGYTEQQVRNIIFGYAFDNEIVADNELEYDNGIFAYEPTYVESKINSMVEAKEKNEFVLGIEYPDFDWKSIIKKYKVSTKPKELSYKRELSDGSYYEYYYQVFVGEKIAFGHNLGYKKFDKNGKVEDDYIEKGKVITDLNKLTDWQKEREYTAGFNGGYWYVVSSKIETIDDILKTLLSQKEGYCKELNFYADSFSETLNQNKISFADGGAIGSGKNGYVAFYKGKRIEVYADTIYQAQKTASEYFKTKKGWEVNVVLAEVDGKPYVRDTLFANGGSTNHYVIVEGYDSFKNRPLYQVIDKSEQGEYVGEYHTNRKDAEEELEDLKNSYANGGSFAPNVADGTQFMNGVYADGGLLSSNQIEKLDNGFTIPQLDDMLREMFPYSFGFEVWKAGKMLFDYDYDDKIKDDKLKLYFYDKTSRRDLNYQVHQGEENTYFDFKLFDQDQNTYIGGFGFKDRGDVDKSYITKFVSFLQDAYHYPLQVRHFVMANGGGVSGRLESGVYRVGKPTKVSANLYEQKIVEIFDNGDISTASDYGRKLSDFKSQKYPIITKEQLEAQYKMANGGGFSDYLNSPAHKEMFEKAKKLTNDVKGRVVIAVGLDDAIKFYDADYPVRPFSLIERAIKSGFMTLDEINERVVDSAMETAQDSEDDEEVGSSDFGAYLHNFLDEAGFKVGYVNGRLTREYANGGSFAPNVSDGTAFMDNAYFADGGEIRRFDRHEQMDSQTREEILDIVSEPELRGSLTNYLYGLYDGYDYSQTERFKEEMKNLKSKDSVLHDRINAIYKKIDKYKFEQYDEFANGGGVGARHLVGEFNEQQLRKGEDKIAIEKAQNQTGLTYIQSKVIKKGGKPFMQVYLISNEEYYKSNEFANGGMFDDNDGFMRADNERSFRYPEREVRVDSLEESVDLTNNVSYRPNEVVIRTLDENIDLNDDNRIRARMGSNPMNRNPNKMMAVNPRMIVTDLPKPTSNTHKND